MVLDGAMRVHFREGTVLVQPGELLVVPRGKELGIDEHAVAVENDQLDFRHGKSAILVGLPRLPSRTAPRI